jgi:copper homeostasis protein
MLEIIIETLADALAAQAGGATQLDFKSALPIGGLTPSAGMMEQVCKSVDIDALVMIRPHARSFVFSNAEVAVMCGDILRGRKLGAAGFLTGCLTEEGQVDVEAVKALQDAAGDLPLHFHLAWELTSDPSQPSMAWPRSASSSGRRRGASSWCWPVA